MATKVKLKRFIFLEEKGEWEIPAHWTIVQIDTIDKFIVVWAYRNGQG